LEGGHIRQSGTSAAQHEPHEVFADVQERLARAGVALVVIPLLKGSAFRGCTRLLNPAKAMIVHSLKYKNPSEFWRVLFHEIAHLVLHINSPEDCFEEYDDQNADPTEMEADSWADGLLVYKENSSRSMPDTKNPPLGI
jgi:HTH-type transcriptional regulator/antitoxin HigA